MDPQDPVGGNLTLERVVTSDLRQLGFDLFDWSWLFGLSVRAVEVTQAVQYLRSAEHLTDPADRAPDNSVTLIADKPAWVRIYVRSGPFAGTISGVTGTLEVRRRVFGAFYLPVGTRTPEPPGSVTAFRTQDYAVERGTITSTLNFVVPADWMCGHLRFRVSITEPGGRTDQQTLYLDVTLRQTLRTAGVMVGYNGPASSAPNAPNLTLAAPTLANLQTTSAWTLLTFPVQSTAVYRNAGTITWNLPLTDAPSCPGCCSPNWVALNAAVQAQQVADGNRPDFLYYGLMAAGIPMGPIVGCNTGGTSTGTNGAGVTMAHELGHHCGLPHAPCGTPGDPNYPAYEPYDPAGTPQASIGEYGLDISNGAVKSPATFKDMMSYCTPRWISLYNYGRLTNNARLDPVRACEDSPWWRDIVLYDPPIFPERWLPDPPPEPTWITRVMGPQRVISIIGVLHPGDEVEVKSVMRLETHTESTEGQVTDLLAELMDAKGDVLASAPVVRVRSAASGCGCDDDSSVDEHTHRFLFQAFVPDVGPGSRLRMRRGDETLWARSAPRSKPKLAGFTAEIGKRGDTLRVAWDLESSGEELEPEAWLQWTSRGREGWQAVASGLRPGAVSVDASALPPGRVSLRLLASDGFHTVRSRSIQVAVPGRPPSVSILSPRDGQTLIAGATVRLLGAVEETGREASAQRVRWEVDGKELATGLDAFVMAPEPGEHRLTLSVRMRGTESSDTITVTCIEIPTEPPEGEV